MNISWTTWTMRLLLINGIALSFMIIQKFLDWNLVPDVFENFAWALVGAFEIVVLMFYFQAVRDEEAKFTRSIESIDAAL